MLQALNPESVPTYMLEVDSDPIRVLEADLYRLPSDREHPLVPRPPNPTRLHLFRELLGLGQVFFYVARRPPPSPYLLYPGALEPALFTMLHAGFREDGRCTQDHMPNLTNLDSPNRSGC